MASLGDRLADGDEEAFAELYDAACDRLFAYLSSATGRVDLAEDAVQDAFVRLARHREKLRQVEDPVAYLFRVARNEQLRELERRSRSVSAAPAEVAEQSGQLSRELRRVDDRDWATTVLQSLPPAAREVVELKVYGELTLKEIAEVTDSPQGTVASRYRDAVARLRALEMGDS